MRRAALLVLAVAVVGVPAPASAASERMELRCASGLVVERTNGHSWWGVTTSAGYVSERLVVDGRTVHEHAPRPGGERTTCLADHHGSTWEVVLVRTR